MKYEQVLKQLWKDFDPFLHVKPEEIIEESTYFFVLPARSPYADDHLLIIPKRKVYVLRELSNEERLDMYDLLEKRSKRLHTAHRGVNLLLRDWLVWDWDTEIWKSINHLHFHLIPDCSISTDKVLWHDRKFLSDDEYIWTVKQIKKDFLWI